MCCSLHHSQFSFMLTLPWRIFRKIFQVIKIQSIFLSFFESFLPTAKSDISVFIIIHYITYYNKLQLQRLCKKNLYVAILNIDRMIVTCFMMSYTRYFIRQKNSPIEIGSLKSLYTLKIRLGLAYVPLCHGTWAPTGISNGPLTIVV